MRKVRVIRGLSAAFVVSEVNGNNAGIPVRLIVSEPGNGQHHDNGAEMGEELLVRGREQRLKVWEEIYSYAAGMTTINASVQTRPQPGRADSGPTAA